MSKTYKKGDIEIVWRPGLCVHSGVCVKGLPEVFKPKEIPWIDTEKADQLSLVEQVYKCPSGALSIEPDENSL